MAAPRTSDPLGGRPWGALVFCTDLLLLWTALTVVTSLAPAGPLPGETWLLAVAFAAGTLGHLGLRGAYSSAADRRGLLDVGGDLATAHATGLAIALAVTSLSAEGRAVSMALVESSGLALVLVGAGRGALLTVRHRARVSGRSQQLVLIVGAGAVGAELERRMLADPGLGLLPVGFLDADPAPAFEAARPVGPVLGTPAELAAVVQSTGATQLIVAFSAARDADVVPIVRAAQALGLEVSVVPRMFEDVSVHQRIDYVGGMALCRMRNPNPRSWPFMVKHALGRVIALTLVLLGGPLLLALALGVRLSSPGPILFRQLRVGRDGQVFEILKFRTMRQAPPAAAGARPELVVAGVGPGGVEGDDRRTAIGTFLRRSSLDELPQLFNVLLGHMSIVGPRPERPDFVALFSQEVRGYGDRHRVKSGMTGWAQVHGLRGQTSIAERIELDNWYVANWSLWLDVKIILMTPLEVLRSRAEARTGAPQEPALRSVPSQG